MTIPEVIDQITRVGRLADGPPDALTAALRLIPRSAFHPLAEHRFFVFAFLADIPFDEAFAFMRGLMLCETHRVSPFPGSTSLINPAWLVIRQRPLEEWVVITDWIITHSDNPYIPFNFRASRYQWEAVRETASTPAELWQAYRDAEDRAYAASQKRAREHAARMHAQEAAAAQRHAERAAAQEAHRARSIASSRLRQQRLSDMAALSPVKRLKIIADDATLIGYWPPSYAVISDDDLSHLDDRVLSSLRTKLADRRHGPWRELFIRLSHPSRKNGKTGKALKS